MPAGLLDAPDIGAAPPIAAPVAAAPEQSEFQTSAAAAVKDLPVPEGIEGFATDHGKTPEETASALQRARVEYHDRLTPEVGDSPEYPVARAKIDEDFNKAVTRQRDKAVQGWAQSNFQDGDQYKQFIQSYQQNPDAAAQANPKAKAELDSIVSSPRYREYTPAPASRIQDRNGRDAGWSRAFPDGHGGFDVHVTLNNGKKGGTYKVKGVTSDEVKGAPDPASARRELFAKRFKEGFEKSPIHARSGNLSVGTVAQDIARGTWDTALNVVAGVAGIVSKDAADAYRAGKQAIDERLQGTTRPTMTGDIVRETGELAGKLPIWTLGGTPAMAADFYGGGVDRAKQKAAQLRDQGKIEEANKIDRLAHVYGAASAATAYAAPWLAAAPIKAALARFGGKAAAEKFLATFAGKAIAEAGNLEAITAAQGQGVDPAFIGERGALKDLLNPSTVLFGIVFGGKRHFEAKKAAAEAEKTKLVKDAKAGDISNPAQIFDAIHGKAEVPTGHPYEAHASGTLDGLTDIGTTEGDAAAGLKVNHPYEAHVSGSDSGLLEPPPSASEHDVLNLLPARPGDTVSYEGIVGKLQLNLTQLSSAQLSLP